MRGKARPAILGRIVAFDQDRFVGPHLGHVEPTVSGVVPDAVGLAYPVAVDQIRGDEIRESDARRVANTASGASRNGPRIGRHTLTISTRWRSSSSASSPIKSRTRCGPDFTV